MSQRRVKIVITGETIDDLVYALEEVEEALRNEFLVGSGSNDTGSYTFDVIEEGDES